MLRWALCAAVLLVAGPVVAQTSNPTLNDLLGRAERERAGGQQDISNVQAKDRALRTQCWRGDHDACVALRRLNRNPNLDLMGSLVERPPGAYWPFDPWGNPQESGRW